MAVEFHRLKIADVRRETPEAVSIAFAVPRELSEAYRFHPGQHLTLRTQVDGAEVRRSYSICVAPDDGELRVAVKKVEGGLFSTLANDTIKRGDEIDVMTPQGRFGVPLDPQAARTYVAIVAGSGITPIMSIMRTVLTHEPKARVVLIYGNRTTQSIIFREALEDVKDRFMGRFTVHHVLSREHQEIDAVRRPHRRRQARHAAAHACREGGIDHALLCGPGGLIEDGKAALLRFGLPAERIHVEYFSADGSPIVARAKDAIATPDAQEATVEIAAQRRPPRRAGARRRDHRRCRPARRAGDALFVPRRHVLHLPRQGDRRRSPHGHELFAGAVGARGRLRAHLPVASGDGEGGARLRSGVRRFIPPPLAGEGAARSEPGGGVLNCDVTPPRGAPRRPSPFRGGITTPAPRAWPLPAPAPSARRRPRPAMW